MALSTREIWCEIRDWTQPGLVGGWVNLQRILQLFVYISKKKRGVFLSSISNRTVWIIVSCISKVWFLFFNNKKSQFIVNREYNVPGWVSSRSGVAAPPCNEFHCCPGLIWIRIWRLALWGKKSRGGRVHTLLTVVVMGEAWLLWKVLVRGFATHTCSLENSKHRMLLKVLESQMRIALRLFRRQKWRWMARGA